MGNPTALIDDIQRMTPIEPVVSSTQVRHALADPGATAALAVPLADTRLHVVAQHERTMVAVLCRSVPTDPRRPVRSSRSSGAI